MQSNFLRSSSRKAYVPDKPDEILIGVSIFDTKVFNLKTHEKYQDKSVKILRNFNPVWIVASSV